MPTVNANRRPARVKPVPRMTYEQFLEWMDEDIYAEWVDGEVQFMSPAGDTHQVLMFSLARVMAEYLETHPIGEVRLAPFQMKLPKVRRGREPDIMFIANDNLGRIGKVYLEGPADLAVEIISPESRLRDKGEKYAEYEIEGVREYWVIDHEEQRVDFYVLSDERRYERRKVNSDGIYHSAVLPGFWIKTGWLWQSPPPTMQQVRAEWGTP